MDTTEKCHSPSESPPTFGLPKAYEGISAWAVSTGMHPELEIAYFCLGRPDDPRAIHNFANEFTQAVSQPILSDWADRPIVLRLWKFSLALRSANYIHKADSPISHKGKPAAGTKAEFSPLKTRFFLLAMIVNPRSEGDTEARTASRQRLRLWLIIQAAIRIADQGNIADTSISQASRYLILDRIDPKWDLVDSLLTQARHETAGYPNTFQWFTYAVKQSAKALSNAATDSEKTFLNSLIFIAEGNNNPLPHAADVAIPGPYIDIEGIASAPVPLSDPDLPAVQTLQGLPENGEDAPDDVLVEVDVADTDEEQALTSRSVFLYSAEESQFLPWSWDKLLPPEIEQVSEWMAEAMRSGDPVPSLGAAIVKVAMTVGNSLFHAERITFDDALGRNWSITPDCRHIQRFSPTRSSYWRPETDIQRSQVKPFVGIIRLALPSGVGDVLKSALSAQIGNVMSIGQLWRAINPATKLTVWFDAVARDRFPRVTSGKLGQVASQRAFDNTGDPHLARIATASPQSGLPAACSYANWDVTTIAKGLEMPVVTEGAEASTLLLGSLLAPLEPVLIDGIADAKSLVYEAEDLVSFHNRYTQYCLLAMYAGTGGRYLKSPFESLGHFNLRFRCVYINDKSDGQRHDGRMVPLPDNLIVLMRAYQDYLSMLAVAIAPHKAELAEKIHMVLGCSECDLPLFFLLDKQLSWRQSSDSDVLGLPQMTWSLPSNVFRHRYSQQLSRAGIPQDIVDGWMGHSERGGASYGDFSPRCWVDDANRYREKYNAIYDALGFTVIPAPANLPSYTNSDTTSSKYEEPTLFGLRERRQQRRDRYKNALRIARREITLFIGDRPLEELESSEVEALANRLLKRENGLPHRDAGIRYRALEQFLRSQNSKHTRSIRKKMLKRNDERNNVQQSLPRDLDLYDLAKSWAEKVSQTIKKGQVNKTNALIMGTTLLCIQKRLSYRRLLFDAIKGQNFRLVQHRKKYFFEYSEELESDDYLEPVQRHEIGYKVASLLQFGISHSRLPDVRSLPVPRELHSLVRGLWPEEDTGTFYVADFLKRLSKVVEQANLVQLPGMVAGALSERMPPTSLNWADLLRLRHGITVKLPGRNITATVEEDFSFSKRTGYVTDSSALQDNARALYSEITNALQGYEKSSAKRTATIIDDLCKSYRGRVSSSVQMMPHWVSCVIREGRGRGKVHKPYAKRTVQNYFSALRLAFQGIAYAHDLLSMDSESITDLYHDMATSRRERDKEVGYFGKRLKAFHRWAERFGVERPEWSEIDTDDNHRSVRPGCISEKEYLACMEYIDQAYRSNEQLGLYLGFVLLLAFRFGLRGGEAIGLRRQDWCQWQGFTWVLVRDNRIRQLKRASSRRAVPLLFELTKRERVLIDRVLANYDSLAGLDQNAPILCENQRGRVAQAAICQDIQETLTAVLRSVTGSQSLTTHLIRHAFHNHLAPILLGFHTPTTQAICGHIDHEHVRKWVLGQHSEVSIRSSMGLSRLMGHSGPSSGLKNYNHLVSEWADALTPVNTERALDIAGIFNTREFERVELEKPEQPPEIAFHTPTLLLTFKLLRLVSQGRSYPQAGKLLSLHPGYVADIQTNFYAANRVMRFKKRGENGWFKGLESPNAILHYINDSAWDRLLKLAASAEVEIPSSDVPLPELDELPLLLGMTRMIKMSHDRHCEIVRSVFDIFGISERNYDVTVSADDPVVTQLLKEYQFQVRPICSFHESGKPLQLDVFNRGIEERHGRILDYGVVVFKQSDEGVVRNAYQLAVAFLATASLIVRLACDRKKVAPE
ncbi:tyrosine-type recombinase/integrase [Spongiibacter sp.]|jgi:site-specific recombinase XerD|uniref:tyrosine-type recombinase/integrase n=1 Tax=Spongiibacter sp. TaxID=2024860 RepID=UPI000C3C4EA1|nr:tyrosine-type recombinase/integrase [Spongiibacter sp.]MAY39122.1 hypothetical protein [Spongiibacter sp.]|tara:strand:+ start:2105 stop:7474 length:5370 start_codon:yes stop_codon:yes gene_type:complete